MDDLEQILSCSICIEPFKTPRQLPCQHSYCTLCLSEHIRKTKRRNAETGFNFSCPLCRDTVQLFKCPFDANIFPINLTIQSILDSKKIMELMDAKTVSSETKTDQSVMTNIETRSQFIQTDELTSNRDIDSTRTHPTDLLNELFRMNLVSIPNIYPVFLKLLVEPFISGNNSKTSKLRRGITSLFAFLLIICFVVVILKSIETDRKSLVFTLYSCSLLFQLLFVRIKLAPSRLRHRLYAFVAYIVIYIITTCATACIFVSYIDHVSRFVVMQKYTFKWKRNYLDTAHGFKTQDTVIPFKEAERANSEFLNSKIEDVFNEYHSFINTRLFETYLNIFVSLQKVVWGVPLLVGVIVIYWYRNLQNRST